MKKNVKLSGIAYESLVNGPGLRRVFFAQGCRHKCKGCFNTETHDFLGGEYRNIDELITYTLDNPMLTGVTFSGGDPWYQADRFAYMAKAFKEKGLNVWCYTGYKYEHILGNMDIRIGWKDLLNNIDILVDGKFEEDKQQDGLKYRGSTNQRIIDVQKSLSSNSIITLHY